MRDKLGQCLEEVLAETVDERMQTFRTVFLLDGFSAIGLSYIRRDDNTDEIKDSIAK